MRRQRKRYYYNNKKCSKGEYRIAKILEANNIKFIMEKKFKTCLSPKGNPLRFDFWIPSYNLLIEFNGDQHNKPLKNTIHHMKQFKVLVTHDNIKKVFAKRNKIPLATIPYKFIDDLNTVVPKILTEAIQKQKEEVSNDNE